MTCRRGVGIWWGLRLLAAHGHRGGRGAGVAGALVVVGVWVWFCVCVDSSWWALDLVGVLAEVGVACRRGVVAGVGAVVAFVSGGARRKVVAFGRVVRDRSVVALVAGEARSGVVVFGGWPGVAAGLMCVVRGGGLVCGAGVYVVRASAWRADA